MNAALPKFSDEAVVRDRCAFLETSGSFLAALAGIPQSRISQAFNGVRALSPADRANLKALTARLIELKDACGIFPLSLNNAERVRRLLDRMEKKEITVEQVRATMSGLFGE
jgi:hypothetical protein